MIKAILYYGVLCRFSDHLFKHRISMVGILFVILSLNANNDMPRKKHLLWCSFNLLWHYTYMLSGQLDIYLWDFYLCSNFYFHAKCCMGDPFAKRQNLNCILLYFKRIMSLCLNFQKRVFCVGFGDFVKKSINYKTLCF